MVHVSLSSQSKVAMSSYTNRPKMIAKADAVLSFTFLLGTYTKPIFDASFAYIGIAIEHTAFVLPIYIYIFSSMRSLMATHF
jgi:hypothetical protein